MPEPIPSLTDLYKTASQCVVAFVNRAVRAPVDKPPLMPHIIGTGFLANAEGLVITNRHVVETLETLAQHQGLGGAFIFLSEEGCEEEEGQGCQLLSVPIASTSMIDAFTSSEEWYGQRIPDIGFVQLKVRENQFLELATEKYAVRPGMEVSTIGYPLGTLALTLEDKISQISPFIRRGIVSSVHPCPVARPHGFTIDIVQQKGSSGSPIFGPDNRRVVGMMWGVVSDTRSAVSDDAYFVINTPTNISIAEPAFIIAAALKEQLKNAPPTHDLPTLSSRIKDAEKQAINPSGMPWLMVP